MLGLVYAVLELVSCWFIFKKYGEPGWKGLIPFYSDYIEYGKVWTGKGMLGLLATLLYGISCGVSDDEENMIILIVCGICALVYLVLNIIFASKKSKAFGKGTGMTLLLIFLPFIANLMLAFGDAEYLGSQD